MSSFRGFLAVLLFSFGCVASPEHSISDAPYDPEPIHLELSEPVAGLDDPALIDALAQLDEAPTGSTLRYPMEAVLEDGSRFLDTVTVQIEDVPAEDEGELTEEPRLLSDPLLPIAECTTATTVTTRSRTRTWESCFTYPDSEARRDAERAVRATVDASCRSSLDSSDGRAFCAARGMRFIAGQSTVSTDGICERETVSVSVTHSRGTNTCLFGAYATYRSRATATSTSPRCGFACQR